MVGLAELAFLIAWAAGLFYVGGKRLYEEVAMLANRFPWFLEQLDLYLTGMKYTQIAKVLGRDDKSTDNALQRIKTKAGKLLERTGVQL